MAEQDIGGFLEDWQTGFFLLIGIGLLGVLAGAVVGSVTGGTGRYLGTIGGMVLGFLLVSYAVYGK